MNYQMGPAVKPRDDTPALWNNTTTIIKIILLLLITTTATAKPLPLEKIQLPPGFHIELFADNIPGARQMTLGTNNTLFVGTRREGKVYALTINKNGTNAEKNYPFPGWTSPPPKLSSNRCGTSGLKRRAERTTGSCWAGLYSNIHVHSPYR